MISYKEYTVSHKNVELTFTKFGKLAFVSVIQSTYSQATVNAEDFGIMIPSEFKPIKRTYLWAGASFSGSNLEFYFNPAGNITYARTTGTYAFGSASWICKE